MLSLISPPSTGACVWHRLGACSAPALMGPPKASSMCLVTKVLGAHSWGWARVKGKPQKPGPTLSVGSDTSPRSCSAQGPHLCHLWLQPLCEHRLWEACSAATGGYRSHGLRGVWHHRPQPHPADGQPCYRGPGTATLGRCGRSQLQQKPENRHVCVAWQSGPSHTLLTPTQLLQPTQNLHRPLREHCSPGGRELTENYSGMWVHLGTHTTCLVFMGGLEQMRGTLCEACPPLGWALYVDITDRE